jgi:hypothetical protein
MDAHMADANDDETEIELITANDAVQEFELGEAPVGTIALRIGQCALCAVQPSFQLDSFRYLLFLTDACHTV